MVPPELNSVVVAEALVVSRQQELRHDSWPGNMARDLPSKDAVNVEGIVCHLCTNSTEGESCTERRAEERL